MSRNLYTEGLFLDFFWIKFWNNFLNFPLNLKKNLFTFSSVFAKQIVDKLFLNVGTTLYKLCVCFSYSSKALLRSSSYVVDRLQVRDTVWNCTIRSSQFIHLIWCIFLLIYTTNVLWTKNTNFIEQGLLCVLLLKSLWKINIAFWPIIK